MTCYQDKNGTILQQKLIHEDFLLVYEKLESVKVFLPKKCGHNFDAPVSEINLITQKVFLNDLTMENVWRISYK